MRRPLWLVPGLALAAVVIWTSAATCDASPRVATRAYLFASRSELCAPQIPASQRTVPWGLAVDIVGRERWACGSSPRQTVDVVQIASVPGDTRGGFIDADMLEPAPPVRPIDYIVFMLAFVAMVGTIFGSIFGRKTAGATAGYDGRFAVAGLPTNATRILLIVGYVIAWIPFALALRGPILRGDVSPHFIGTIVGAAVAAAMIWKAFASYPTAPIAATAQGDK